MTQAEVRALKPTEIVLALSQVTGWTLSGDGEFIAIEKTFEFTAHGHAR
jgi:4a-hydroxytetrahydrobiopterin dehydratase